MKLQETATTSRRATMNFSRQGTFLKMHFKKLHRTKKRVHREKLGDLFPIYFILYKTTFKVKNLIHR